MPQESLGDRVRRLRHERGMSLARVAGADFSRAFLNQVELGHSQPSTRVLRVIATRLGTGVEFLLNGSAPNRDREITLERARVDVARGRFRQALRLLAPFLGSSEWPLGTEARICAARAHAALGHREQAGALLSAELELATARGDSALVRRLRHIRDGSAYPGGDPAAAAAAHVRLADRARLAGEEDSALEHYRAARVLLETARDTAYKLGGKV
jgi:transcriptional regulator with XRE-family HTH domain